jgi:hypothetical protein
MPSPLIKPGPPEAGITAARGLAGTVGCFARRVEAALSRPRLLLAVLGVYLPIFAVYFASSTRFSLRHAADACGGQPILDQRWGYTAPQVTDYLRECGAAGRAAITAQQDADLFYPALFGVVLTMSLALLLRAKPPDRHWAHALVLLPSITTAADYLENICIRVLLAAYPQQPRIVPALSAVTTVKLATGWASIAALVILATTAAIRRLGTRFASSRYENDGYRTGLPGRK